MDDPTAEIPSIIHALTQSPPSVQRLTLEKYFTPNASFTHPFCRTGSFNGSRLLILAIYRWYKILSPRIDLKVLGVAFDEKNLTLYVSIHQTFRILCVPFYSAPVNLTTVLFLTTTPPPPRSSQQPTITLDSAGVPHTHTTTHLNEWTGKNKYWITAQNDLYQTSELMKFVLPFGVGWAVVIVWHFFATWCCVIGAVVGWPVSLLMEAAAQKKEEDGGKKE